MNNNFIDLAINIKLNWLKSIEDEATFKVNNIINQLKAYIFDNTIVTKISYSS